MTNTNDNPENWEPSTTNQDQLKEQNKNRGILAKGLIGAINLAISGYNNTIGKASKLVPGIDWTVPKLDLDKTLEEIQTTGGSSFALGIVDDAVKFVRRSGLPLLNGISVFGYGGPQIAMFLGPLLNTVESAVDHLKDLIQSSAMSSLAANIGDLKEGQAKLNAKVDAQGKRLSEKMNGIKTELEKNLTEAKKDLENQIKNADAEQKKELKKAKEELRRQIEGVQENLNQVERQLTNALNDFRNEVNDRFAEQEQKILNNKRKIEEEKLQRENEIRETHDKVKLTNTNLENLRKEKQQLEDEFLNYKSSINQQTADTQQNVEDLEAEYQRKTKILEAKIEDNQETLEEFNEQLNNVQHEQARQKAEQEEIWEELQETNETLFIQQHKLNLVAQQMEDISEEIHQRMDKVQGDHQKLFTLAQDTSQKVSNLTEQVQNIWTETENLQAQIKKNKADTEKIKKEAKLANERLDNLIKTQTLSDYSAQESKIDKIQKSLELKAEESKLLATLNLLSETKKLIKVEPAERDWKVGVKTGTANQDLEEPEHFTLTPNNIWEQKYTGDQVKPDNPHALFTQEWFNWEEENKLAPEETKLEWGSRIKNEENETAPLTDLEKRKEQQTEENQPKSKSSQLKVAESAETLEKLEQLKTETLTRLQEIQQQIQTNLEVAEQEPLITKNKPSAKYSQPIKQSQQKVQQLQKKLASKQEKTKQAVQQTLTNPTPQTKKELVQTKQEEKQVQQELAQAQSELNTLQSQQDFEQNLEKHEEKTKQDIYQEKKEEVKEQWTTIQALSKKALQEQPKKDNEEKSEENNLDKKLEELTQQIKQLEENQAASQKQMTYAMLFLIIFLLEYVVYKRNGLPGLVILNVLLSIAYYYREDLKKYADLWGKYLLIIGYVMGNVLAYSAPEPEKYKWPAVAGFNACILAIYAYTWYQQKQEQSKLEAVFTEKTAQIREEYNITEPEWANIQQNNASLTGIGGYIDEYSVFSNSGALKMQQLEDLKETIQQKQLAEQITKQKQLELQQQAETLQQAAEIEEKLKEIHSNLGESRITWTKIYQTYPEFKDKSLLLKEFEKADKLLKSEQKEEEQAFLKRLARIPTPSKEESDLLSNLNLTIEQYIAISLKTPYLNATEKQFISDNYPSLDLATKLALLNSGLNALEIDNLKKKEKFVELNHALHQEKQLFGLNTKEKENILRLLVNTLNLSSEQQAYLENMGISFFNASEWVIDGEQKNHLLSFGLQKIKLSENQQDNLLNLSSERLKTFSLSEEQKNILLALAPLTREDKYSSDSLQLLNSLALKSTSLNFLINEEILPSPQNDFGETKSPYLPLKTKFLLGEQKILIQQQELQEKHQKEEEIKQKKLSILESLLEFSDNRPCLLGTGRDNEDGSTTMAVDPDLKDFNYSLSEWVNQGVLKSWQSDILLTLGLKTIPKYNYFELLAVACEINEISFTELLDENYWLEEQYQKYLAHQRNQPITINKQLWEKFVASQTSSQKETLNNLNLEELINQQINKALGNWKPTETPEENWTNISLEFTPDLVQAWKDKGFTYQTCQEWIQIGLTPQDSEFAYYLQNELTLTAEQVLNQGNLDYLREQFIEQQPKEAPEEIKPSRYDTLLDNLSKEDAEREKKKQERKEAQNKFEEAERQRREKKLEEKEQKLKEDEEKHKKEKELAEKEEQKRREAEEARSKALQEEQNRIFSTKMKNIEEAKKRAEEALENQKKANELAEQKKKDEIEKLQKENDLEQTRLANQAKLIEEEKQKKLAAIALEDTEQRQRIQREADAEKARILEEANDKRRKHEQELKKKEAELLKQQQTQQVEIERLTKERELQTKMGQELARLANEQTRILRENKNSADQLRAYRESIWNYVLDYYWASNESSSGTQNPTQYSGGTLRSWLSSSSNSYMKFNLVNGDKYSVNWRNNGWKLAMKAFYGIAGNTFVDQYEFQRLLEQKVLDMNFLDRIDG